jgi:hypothetical protein
VANHFGFNPVFVTRFFFIFRNGLTGTGVVWGNQQVCEVIFYITFIALWKFI